MKFEEITDWDGYVAACKVGGECGACKGTGIFKGYTIGTCSAPDRVCYTCDGRKVMPGFDPLPLAKGCFVVDKKTSQPKRWKRSAPSKMQHRKPGSEAARVYYLWRMARFHVGADCSKTRPCPSIRPALPCPHRVTSPRSWNPRKTANGSSPAKRTADAHTRGDPQPRRGCSTFAVILNSALNDRRKAAESRGEPAGSRSVDLFA